MKHLRLVSYNGEWAVCELKLLDEPPGQYDLPTDPIRQFEGWVYGKNQTLLCRVGQQDQLYPLPQWEPTDFFGDRFPFAIDVQTNGSEFREKVGGCSNAIAARAAAEVYVREANTSTTVRLRHGARIILEQSGTDDFREWLATRQRLTRP